MSNAHKIYEVRCPVYGFIQLTNLERDIISQPAFQRLRRVRQLAWTDQVYPGATHSRFEHSLGVMHMATQLYDKIISHHQSRDLLEQDLEYNEDGLRRDRTLVRLAALLHDVGHAPFSHAAEDLFPKRPTGEKFEHEHYSAAIVRKYFGDVIEQDVWANNYGFTANDVANLLEGNSEAKRALFWQDLLSGQMDADRMDYLLRDSLHIGVAYGRYDWHRLIHTMQVIPGSEHCGPRLGVSEGGWHAAEGLILARYFMFTQVYFHKTRVAFDCHLFHALKEMLPEGVFPAPSDDHLDEYLEWDDWKVLGLLKENQGGEHGKRLLERNHYREIAHTSETPSAEEIDDFKKLRDSLGKFLAAEEHADKSWYKLRELDIPVCMETKPTTVKPLSKLSSIVGKIEPIQKVMLYVRPEDRVQAQKIIEEVGEGQ